MRSVKVRLGRVFLRLVDGYIAKLEAWLDVRVEKSRLGRKTDSLERRMEDLETVSAEFQRGVEGRIIGLVKRVNRDRDQGMDAFKTIDDKFDMLRRESGERLFVIEGSHSSLRSELFGRIGNVNQKLDQVSGKQAAALEAVEVTLGMASNALEERVATLEERYNGIQTRVADIEGEYVSEYAVPEGGAYDVQRECDRLVSWAETLDRRVQRLNDGLNKVLSRVERLRLDVGVARPCAPELPPHQRRRVRPRRKRS